MSKLPKMFGVIDRDWASYLYEWGSGEVYERNTQDNIDFLQGVELDKLGGLAVRLPSLETFSLDKRMAVRSARSVIDLAYKDPGFVTLAPFVVSAVESREGKGTLLSQQLANHSALVPEELWFIPTEAIQIVDASRV